MVEQFSDKGVELLMVMQETENFNEAPTQTDCQALQATQKATVMFVPDHAVTEVLGIKVNMGAALLDENGIWLSPPVGDDSYAAAISELYSQVGFGGPGGF